ncbi:MAG: type II toxin-antitoxin system RelE/ParE family toxin [Acidobacteriota bacterium]|nr:type II toxin-antitoxin system RelE/ParE family toxin [Acidobacteriota bacterium]
MKVKFERSFEKDLRQIGDKKVLQKLKLVIEQVKNAANSSTIKNLKKLRGFETFYRIKLNDYRIGIEIADGEFIFTRVLHRKEVYRFFP